MTVQTNTAQATEIKRLFEKQRAYQYELARTTASERIKKLRKLSQCVMKYRQEIRDALWNDFRKHPAEVDLTEIFVVTSHVKHNIRHLRQWMRPQRVPTPLPLLGSSSRVVYEPKGMVLLLSPWNFPVNLTLGPLVSAIAAGNTVILKPSEHTPHASAVMKKIVAEIFDEREVALVEGAVETAQTLLSLPFNHIFFTGAPAIGKVVMKAAAEHLASVTLELGGKSPIIVDASANLDKVAGRLTWAKFMNNGQICIAPDYLFVHEHIKDKLIAKVKEKVEAYYGRDSQQSSDYARMVNNRHYERVKGYVDDALDKGAEVLHGGRFDGDEDFISPTLVEGVPMDAKLMTEEIFGPVLPIHTFRDIEEPIQHINKGEKPLALYMYSHNRKHINKVIAETRAGGTCVNHNAIHFFNHHMPFGGSNNSGIGKSHGWYGFQEFSNARSILKQHFVGATDLLVPPYTSFKQKLIDFTLKWL